MTSEPSVDVLAAQVRAALTKGLVAHRVIDEASEALDVLVGYAKRAEELESALEQMLAYRLRMPRDVIEQARRALK